ncbi:MAG: hypothetical protein E6J76_11715, partial [Deltaproteobacteria bacterium]
AASRSTSRTGACSPCAAYNPAFLHPEDLRHIGAQPGDIVRIDSDHDFIYGVAEASVDVRPGVVSMAHATRRCARARRRGPHHRQHDGPPGQHGARFRAHLRHPAPERHPGDRPSAHAHRARRPRSGAVRRGVDATSSSRAPARAEALPKRAEGE